MRFSLKGAQRRDKNIQSTDAQCIRPVPGEADGIPPRNEPASRGTEHLATLLVIDNGHSAFSPENARDTMAPVENRSPMAFVIVFRNWRGGLSPLID